jgi:hypothetical protein
MDIPSSKFVSRVAESESMERQTDDKTPGAGMASLSTSLRALEPTDISTSADATNTTGNPFIRAPSRTNINTAGRQRLPEGRQRPGPHELDSYKWDNDMEPDMQSNKDKGPTRRTFKTEPSGPSAKVPVGVSRLHNVVMSEESIQMEPIYWSPVNDIADVIRGTWFYKDTMLPVEVEVANMLEAGYIELQPWTQTWNDELNSAVEVGALGEMKILHKLWPEKSLKVESRPATSRDMNSGLIQK